MRDEIHHQNWFQKEDGKEHQKDSYIEIDISEDKIFFLDLLENYKIICIQEIGNEMSALVLEDIVTR